MYRLLSLDCNEMQVLQTAGTNRRQTAARPTNKLHLIGCCTFSPHAQMRRDSFPAQPTGDIRVMLSSSCDQESYEVFCLL